MQKTTAENNARVSKKMDAKCNILGYLTTCDEMSRFTPNLYDDIFIFQSKNKVDAISERAKFKRNEELFNEPTTPEVIEEVAAQEPTPEPIYVEEPVREEVVSEPVIELEAEEPVIVLEAIAPVVIPEPEVVEEPVIILEAIAPEVVEEVVVVEEPVIILEAIAPEVVEEEIILEPVAEEQVVEEIQYVEEVIEPVYEEQPVAPFMAILIDPSTEENAELLKERYKTVPLEKRLERANESVRNYYSDLKNELLS
ncbi:MAG: hypothetical protein K2P12_02795, partial [Clostridia bacterium]|nr:hypothetical protein [Clostridia bacterium]